MANLKTSLEKEILLQELPDEAPGEARSLLALWQEFASQGRVPTRDEFSAESLAPWHEDVSIYEYHPDKNDFQILLEGENIIALTGEDWRGAFSREIDCHFSTGLRAALSLARRTGQPQIHQLQIFQKEWRRGVRLLLPVILQKDGKEDVCQVFLAIFPMRDLML
tara:strand:- start:362 stop:856 length:495 start_codon:yes stop_codon:yes gene_type:complete